MAAYERFPATTRSKPLLAYLALLLVALLIFGGASAIWLATDNSGTNSLATDPQSTSPPAPR